MWFMDVYEQGGQGRERSKKERWGKRREEKIEGKSYIAAFCNI